MQDKKKPEKMYTQDEVRDLVGKGLALGIIANGLYPFAKWQAEREEEQILDDLCGKE